MKENKFNFIILLMIVVLFTFSKNAYSQEDVIRVDTDLVTVPVTILDKNGRYVTNLEKENFKLFEDGIEQKLAFFESTEQSFTVLLLLDNSGSMNDYLPNLARAANVFLKQLRPDDQLIVAAFSDKKQIQIILEATKVKNFQEKISLKPTIGDYFTATFDAVEDGIKYMGKFNGRRAIILFSDGEQYGIKASAKSNFRDAEEQEALIYTLRFGVFPTHQPGYSEYWIKKEQQKLIEKVNFYMQGLAQKTGGRSFEINVISDLETTFAQVANELGQQHRIGYYPKDAGKKGERH